ncbi:MAG: AAA family ATPase [Steroidobacteraceae bacterium]
MSAIQIRKAKREGARLVIMLCGPSGSGKTRTALEIAFGLSDYNPAAIGFLDTENRRGSLYADVFADPDRQDRTEEEFLIADLFAPHSPDRYIDAIQTFQRAGVKVLVIDSGSHEWEGIGGCLEIADGTNPNKPNWAKGKSAHKKFMNAVLTSDMHIILCLRAREKAKPEMQKINGVDKLVYVELGMQPITEGNVLYEATASLMLYDEGKRQEVIKCPGPLVPFLARREGYITAADGDQVRRWVEGGKELDPKVESWRNRLISVTDQGVAHIKDCWTKVPAAIKKKLGDEFHQTLLASAAEYERQALDAGNDSDEDLDKVNQAVGSAGQKPAPVDDGAAAE